MPIVTLYKVNFRYTSNAPKTETFDAFVVAADGSSDKDIETLVKAAQPRGAANVKVTEVAPIQKNIIS